MVLTLIITLCLGCEKQSKDPATSTLEKNNHLYSDLEYEEISIAVPIESDKEIMDSIVIELNKMTMMKINTKVEFVYMKRETLQYDILFQLNSGNSDIVYCNNSSLGRKFNDNSLPYLVSQDLVRDISGMLPEYAPALNKAFNEMNYLDYMRIDKGIYGIPIYWPVTDMPIALVRKELISNDTKIESFDDIYTLLVNTDLKGKKYNLYSTLGDIIQILANINDYYTIPSNSNNGYIYDRKKDNILRFEDTNIINELSNYISYYDTYGVNSNYTRAINDGNTGVILTTAIYYMNTSIENYEFDYYLLYKGKKFQYSFKNVFCMVVSAGSGNSERALILLDYLYSDKEAYDLITYGKYGEDYVIRNGIYVVANPVSLMNIFNPLLISLQQPNNSTYRISLKEYLDGVYIPNYLKNLYNDYELYKKYNEMLYNTKDQFKISEREEIILQYSIAANNKDQIRGAFETMLLKLEKTTNLSEDLYYAIQNLTN